MKTMFIYLLLMTAPVIAAEHDHAADQHAKEHADHAEEGAVIVLSAAQIKQAGIETQVMRPRLLLKTVKAPGNVSFNAYHLVDVTTLVDAVVHARYVHLGDKVQKGQKLLTLISSELARVEAAYLRAEAEQRKSKLSLQRLQGLVKENIVSQARLQQAESTEQVARANLAAASAALSSYGLSAKSIKALIHADRYGQLSLYAARSGTVIEDGFRMGQHIAAGTRLLQIADESTVWVEVKLAQAQMQGIQPGHLALVSVKGDPQIYRGRVINVHHQIDRMTRTMGVRLQLANPKDALHPGMFVRAEIASQEGMESLWLPEQAVQHQGAELIVFVEKETGHFERRELRVGKPSMAMLPVLGGVHEGERVVVKGAFVLASELAKAGFEVHHH